MVRRMDRQGEVLIWCRKCSGHARQRMGPKLMSCRKPEQVGTKDYRKMLKRIQVLEEGRVPAKEPRGWKTEGQKRRITRKEKRLLNEFETAGSWLDNGNGMQLKKNVGGWRCIAHRGWRSIEGTQIYARRRFPGQLAKGGVWKAQKKEGRK